MTEFAPWFVFIHVAGAFAFAAGHGVSIVVAFRLRREREAARLATLLDASSASLMVAWLGLLVLFVAGVASGVMLGSFARLWIWVSLVLLVVIAGLMTPIGVGWFGRIRLAVGQRTRDLKADQPDPTPASPEELALLLDSRRPEALLLVGGGGFLVILWLMMFKPF